MRDDQINVILKTLRDNLNKQSDHVMDAFHSVDKDRSGQLSPEEFSGCLARFGVKLPPQALMAVVSKFDSNGDGNVSYAEFNAVMRGNMDQMNVVRHKNMDALRTAGQQPEASAASRIRPQSSVPRLGTPPASMSRLGTPPAGMSRLGTPPASMSRLGTPPVGELRRVPTPQQLDTFLANAKPKPRPRTAYPTVAKRYIFGELGPPMDGVIHYPYSAMQRLYKDEFETMVMGSITHPYCRTAKANASSLPHNILSGSNFDDGRISNLSNWRSETFRSYVPKNQTL